VNNGLKGEICLANAGLFAALWKYYKTMNIIKIMLDNISKV
jgi:hypothetical protein